MPERVVHWRRSRKDGSMDFRFEHGGEKLFGNVAPASDVDGLQALFERHVGVALPAATTTVALPSELS